MARSFILGFILLAPLGCDGSRATPVEDAPVPATTPSASSPAPPSNEPKTQNSNSLLLRYRDQVRLDASSEWGDKPVSRLIDGDPRTSWFSLGSQVDLEQGHWVEVQFPEAVAVRRVTVLGNRDPFSLTGYTITAGRFDLLDASGNVLAGGSPSPTGLPKDFEILFALAVQGVRKVRFTATADEQKLGGGGSVALAEILIE